MTWEFLTSNFESLSGTEDQLVKLIYLRCRVEIIALYNLLLALPYYRKIRFLIADLLLFLAYFFYNPFRIAKKHNVIYGETPLHTLDMIAERVRDSFKRYCHRYWLRPGEECCFANVVGCKAIGIDLIPTFISKASRIQKITQSTRAQFLQRDFLTYDCRSATAIYLYGTTLEDDLIHKLITKFKTLSKGTKIITVSYPLSEYDASFRLEKEFEVRFPWGKTTVYLNKLMHNTEKKSDS